MAPNNLAWISLALVVLVAAMIALQPAHAHNPANYYPNKWDGDMSVEWRFTEQVPLGTGFRARVVDGSEEWNDEDQPMYFVKRTPQYANFPASSCPDQYQKNAVHYGTIANPGTAAWANISCTFAGSSELHSFQIKFDSGQNWWTDTTNPPGSHLDTWSVSAHEFGHGTGFYGPYADGHFNPDWGICTGPGHKHTMCPQFAYGAQYWRSLEEHDKHTFGDAY